MWALFLLMNNASQKTVLNVVLFTSKVYPNLFLHSPLFKLHNIQSPNPPSVLANMAPPTDDPSPICSSCGRDTGLYDHELDCPEAWLAQDKTDSLSGSEAASEVAQCDCENCRHNTHVREVILPRLRSDENPDSTLADYYGIIEEADQAETGCRARGVTSQPERAMSEFAEPQSTQRAHARYEPTLADFEEYDAMHSYSDRGQHSHPISNSSTAPQPVELTSTSTQTEEDDEEYEIVEEVFWCESCNGFHALLPGNDTKEPGKEPGPETQREQEHDPKTQVVSEAVLHLDVLEWCDGCGRYHAPLVENISPETTCPVSDTEYDAEDEEEEGPLCDDCDRNCNDCADNLQSESPDLGPATSESKEAETEPDQESTTDRSDDEDESQWCDWCEGCRFYHDGEHPSYEDGLE